MLQFPLETFRYHSFQILALMRHLAQAINPATAHCSPRISIQRRFFEMPETGLPQYTHMKAVHPHEQCGRTVEAANGSSRRQRPKSPCMHCSHHALGVNGCSTLLLRASTSLSPPSILPQANIQVLISIFNSCIVHLVPGVPTGTSLTHFVATVATAVAAAVAAGPFHVAAVAAG